MKFPRNDKPQNMDQARRAHQRQEASQKKETKRKLRSFLHSSWPLRILAVLVLAFFLFSYVRSNHMLTTTSYTFTSPYLPNAFNGYKIAQISDLHGKLFGPGGKDLREALDQEKPDLVVITGDLISRGETDPKPVVDSLQAIAKSYPTYYIAGNHELFREAKQGDQGDFYHSLEKIGVNILENRTVPLYYRESRINLAGLKEDLAAYQKKGDLDLETYLGPKEEIFTILLAHNALHFSSYMAWGADLVLAGHVHGGVIRLPILGGLFSPDRSLFPPYSKGLYGEENRAMIVSAGLGSSKIPLRLFNPPELVIVSLQSKSIH